jgi:ParB family transcriptional regulator, chromosome partitioning protein
MPNIRLGQIRIGHRIRALREIAVAELMGSINLIGLQAPITVASGVAKRDVGPDVVVFDLIAGHHRLEACRRLGWEEIPAEVKLMTEAERELWEIDENLCRADLTELERGEHLLKRKDLYERKWPETKRGGDHGNQHTGGKRQDLPSASFAADTAAKTEIAERTIRQSIRRAKAIDEKVRDRVRAVPAIADSGVELDALAELDPSAQKKAVALVEAGQATGIRDAKRLMEPKPAKVQAHVKEAEIARQKRRDAFTRAWNALDEDDRKWALAQIDDVPIADNVSALRLVR